MQVGLSSTVDPETFARPPLSAIFTVDVSGSMGWDYKTQSGDYVRAAALADRLLRSIAERLSPEDHVTLVTYGSSASVVLDVTAGGSPQIIGAIDSLHTTGSTNMEAGLKLAYQVADREQEPHRTQTHLVQLLGVALGGHEVSGQRCRHCLHIRQSCCQPVGFGLEVRPGPGDGGRDLARHVGQRRTLVADDLAEEEVQRLDGRGALVQRVDAGVADVLLYRVVLQEPGSAEGLQRFGQHLVGALGADAFHDGQQQVVHARRRPSVDARLRGHAQARKAVGAYAHRQHRKWRWK